MYAIVYTRLPYTSDGVTPAWPFLRFACAHLEVKVLLIMNRVKIMYRLTF